MKRFLQYAGIFLEILLMTGCLDLKANMQINADKSMDMNMTMEFDLIKYAALTYESDSDKQNMTDTELKKYLDELMATEDFNMDTVMSDEQKKEMENLGYKVTSNLDKDNYKYRILMTQHFNNIDDISKSENSNSSETAKDNIFFIKTSKNTYKVNLNDNQVSTSNSDLEIPEEMLNNISYNYEITFPNKPISHNANQVTNDGKTLIWNLNATRSNNIEFEFTFAESKSQLKSKDELKNTSFLTDLDKETILSFTLIGGGLLTIIITTIVYIKSHKKK